jgi:T5SS/PEP-CTERM-associated repeat protein
MANYFLGPGSGNMAGGAGTANLDNLSYYYGATSLPGGSDTLFIFELGIQAGGYAYYNDEAGSLSVGTLDTWIYGASASPYPADTSPGPFLLDAGSTLTAYEWNASSGAISQGASIGISDTLNLLVGDVAVFGTLSVGSEIELYAATLNIAGGTLNAGAVDEGNYSLIDIEQGATANFTATVQIHTSYAAVPPGIGLIVQQQASPGFVVDGADTEATFSNDIFIGDVGSPPAGVNNGWMTVTNGATATVNIGYVSVGYASQGTGELDVIGAQSADSLLNITSNDLFVGDAGFGLAKIEQYGTVDVGSYGVGGYVAIGNASGGDGTIDIGGAGALLTAPVLVVGESGYGSLDISNGATVATSVYVSLGDSASGNGTITVGGANFINTGDLFVGTSGTGAFNVAGGGTATFDGSAVIGDFAGSNGSIDVSGADAIVNIGSAGIGDLDVGAAGNGSLVLNNGGAVNIAGALVLAAAGATAVGQGSVTIEAGSALTSNGGDIAQAAGGPSDSATITGSGALWTDTGAIYIGDGGDGTLDVLSGGSLDASSNSLQVGNSAGSAGVVLVSGAGASLTAGSVTVGSASGGLGTLAISTGGTITVDTAEIAAGGLLMLNDGSLSTDPLTVDIGGQLSGFGEVAGATMVNGTITAVGGKLEFTGALGGGGTAAIASNSTLALDSAIGASPTIDFLGRHATLEVGATSAAVTNFSTTDTILIDDFVATGTAYSNGVYDLTGTNSQHQAMQYSFSFGSSPTAQQLSETSFSATDTTVITTTACYTRGTRISTPTGECAVESLIAGDLVLTASGASQPVLWVGHRHLDCSRHRRPADVWPVRVSAGAFGERLPCRDLWLSPDHAVFAAGALIPIRHLINDATVTQEARDEVDYWHVELAQHDVLLAEGLPAESYLDTGNRHCFSDGTVEALHPTFGMTADDAWANDACAPLVEGGPTLAAMRAHLADRAALLGCPVSAGLEITLGAAGCFSAAVPPNVPAFRLVSASARHGGDHRLLGALVTGLRIDGTAVSLADSRLIRGFHEVERHGTKLVRWTDGAAVLRLDPTPQAKLVEIEVAAVITEVAEPRAAWRAGRSWTGPRSPRDTQSAGCVGTDARHRPRPTGAHLSDG